MRGGPLFVVNPRSHRVHKHGSVLEDVARSRTSLPLLPFESPGQMTQAIGQFLDGGGGVIFVEGGDGTVVAVLSACLSHCADPASLPRFAILPGGSTNLAHKVMGLKMVRASAIGEMVDRLLATPEMPGLAPHTHRALIVETSADETPQVGFLLSTGSLARAMLYTQQNLHDARRGSVAVVRAVIQLGLYPETTLYSDGGPVIRPSEFTIISEDGEDMRAKTATEPMPPSTFALMSTFDQLSLGLSPFWNRGDHPIGITQGAWPIRNLRRGIAKLLSGQSGEHLEAHGLTSRGCDRLSFACDGPVVLDGEILPMPSDRQFTVSVTPDLKFIR